VLDHSGVGKNLCHLQRLCYWPHMKNVVTRYVKGCVLCLVSKPTNRKLVLYTPLHVSSHPIESVSMDFVGSFHLSRRKHDDFYVIVDWFIKMCVLMPCKMHVTIEQTAHLFFQFVWVHFGFPISIVSDRDSRFLGEFWMSLWRMSDTKLKRSTTFQHQTDGKIGVFDHIMIHLL